MRSYCPAWFLCGVKFHSKYPGFEGFCFFGSFTHSMSCRTFLLSGSRKGISPRRSLMLRIVVQNDILVLVASSTQREGTLRVRICEFVTFFIWKLFVFDTKNINKNWKFISRKLKLNLSKLIKTRFHYPQILFIFRLRLSLLSILLLSSQLK